MYLKNVETEIVEFIQNINDKAIELAKDLILEAKKKNGRIHVTGIGKPSYVSGYIASLLSSTGSPAYFLDGTEAIHGSSGQVLPGDVVIAISNSGETEELKKTIQTVKKLKAKLISVTGNSESWLAKNSDVFLFAGVTMEGDYLNKPPRISILAEVIVLQYLSVKLQEEVKVDEKMYYQWHPGGALGESIEKGGNL